MFELTQRANIDLRLFYIPSESNPADKESRRLSLQDCTLSECSWKLVEENFGPHTVDLMALNSNAMVGQNGKTLRHFTPTPSMNGSGVSIFAQDISSEVTPYVFPPFCMISTVLKFLEEQKPKMCTFVYPRMFQTPLWWPLMQKLTTNSCVLGRKGDRHVILGPTKSGYTPRSLDYDIVAAKLVFS